MSSAAVTLAALATSGAAFFVLLLFAPTLQAPFLVPKFAALELTAALAWMAFLLRRATSSVPKWSRPVSLGALLVVATSVVAWIVAASRPVGAPYAFDAMVRWGALLGLACGASVLADLPYARRRMLEALTIAASTVAVVGLLQHIAGMPLGIPLISMPGSTFGNRNAAAEVMAMTLPLGLGVAASADRWDARGLMYTGLLLELLYVAVTRARGAWLGAACGLSTTLWLTRPRWSRASVAVALIAVVAAAIVASLPGAYNPRDAGDRKRYSGVAELFQEGFDARSTALRTRFGLWRRSASMVRDHPLFGVGPGNWPVEFPIYAEPDAARDGVLSATVAPRQAHDDTLERAAETGMVGLGALVLLTAGVGSAACRRLRTKDRDALVTTAGAVGAMIALVALSIAGFPFEMPGTLAVAGIALGLIAPNAQGGESQTAEPDSRARSRVFASIAAGLALISMCVVRAERNVRSSGSLDAAERAMHRDRGVMGGTQAAEALNRALEARPNDYRSQLRRAQVLLRLGDSAEASRAARRALAVEPYAPNALAALAAAELASGDHEAARAAATRALVILHDFPLALQIRARAAEEAGDMPSAQADREHLRALAAAGDDDTARAARALLGPSN